MRHATRDASFVVGLIAHAVLGASAGAAFCAFVLLSYRYPWISLAGLAALIAIPVLRRWLNIYGVQVTRKTP